MIEQNKDLINSINLTNPQISFISDHIERLLKPLQCTYARFHYHSNLRLPFSTSQRPMWKATNEQYFIFWSKENKKYVLSDKVNGKPIFTHEGGSKLTKFNVTQWVRYFLPKIPATTLRELVGFSSPNFSISLASR